jgi:hypothetical protein
MSFDPAKLLCVTCKREHKIMGSKAATFFSLTKTLLLRLRVEDASLTELSEISKELF